MFKYFRSPIPPRAKASGSPGEKVIMMDEVFGVDL